MARNKPVQYIPREERPEFLALVAELASVLPEQFPDIARQCAEKYHDAVLAGHVDVLDKMEMAYAAVVCKLNGDTLNGCKAGVDSAFYVLERALAAKPGQVPSWGQAGEFLLEVDGLRMRVVLTSNMLGNHRACDLHAVDLDKPFLSTTGYRSASLTVTHGLGETVDQAARRMVLDIVQAEGKLKPIKADAWAVLHPERPKWLVEALAGVRPNGQLAMFGDAPKDPDAKVAKSNAERQRALRKRRKEQQLKPVMLTEVERQWLERLRGQGGGERDQLARELEQLRQEREQFSAQLAECRRYSYDREQALKRTLAEAEAWGEHYRRQRDGKQAEVENLLGVVSELQALAEELSGSAPKVERRPAPEPQPPLAGVVDLAQLDESELELLKSALTEHHEKNKSVLWKDVACESLWKRLSLLQLNKVEWRADPFARWGEDDPVWSKSALQTATAEARQAMAEGLAKLGT